MFSSLPVCGKQWGNLCAECSTGTLFLAPECLKLRISLFLSPSLTSQLNGLSQSCREETVREQEKKN